MKRDKRELQNLAHLQCIELQWLKPNANLHRTMAHKVESHLCDRTAREFDSLNVDGSEILCQPRTRNERGV
jgi:hypothetical protein